MENWWYGQDEGHDDHVAQALKALVLGLDPSNDAVADLIEVLRQVRDFRRDVSEKEWADALRTIYDSVRFHSKGVRGGTRYLSYVSQFVA